MASTESKIRELYESQFEAIRGKDVDRLMSFYAPDVVYFDVVPPLEYAGAGALRDRFIEWFAAYEGPIRFEYRGLTIATSESLAIAHWLSRAAGRLKNGQEIGAWVRATSCSRLTSNATWLFTHEHISLPVDVRRRAAVMDLAP